MRSLTIPNLNANLSTKSHPSSLNEIICDKADVRFYAGDWSEIDKLLPHVSSDETNLDCGSSLNQAAGYDFILMAETVYSLSSLQDLYNLIKKVFFPSIESLKYTCSHIYIGYILQYKCRFALIYLLEC